MASHCDAQEALSNAQGNELSVSLINEPDDGNKRPPLSYVKDVVTVIHQPVGHVWNSPDLADVLSDTTLPANRVLPKTQQQFLLSRGARRPAFRLDHRDLFHWSVLVVDWMALSR